MKALLLLIFAYGTLLAISILRWDCSQHGSSILAYGVVIVSGNIGLAVNINCVISQSTVWTQILSVVLFVHFDYARWSNILTMAKICKETDQSIFSYTRILYISCVCLFILLWYACLWPFVKEHAKSYIAAMDLKCQKLIKQLSSPLLIVHLKYNDTE